MVIASDTTEHEHGLLIGQCYAALRTKIEASEGGLQLHGWQGEHRFVHHSIPVAVQR